MARASPGRRPCVSRSLLHRHLGLQCRLAGLCRTTHAGGGLKNPEPLNLRSPSFFQQDFQQDVAQQGTLWHFLGVWARNRGMLRRMHSAGDSGSPLIEKSRQWHWPTVSGSLWGRTSSKCFQRPSRHLPDSVARAINAFEGSCAACSTLRAASAPVTGSFPASMRPICASTEAWSQ